MPYKDLEKRREAVRKSCKKAYWANPEKSREENRAQYHAHREERAKDMRLRRAADPAGHAAYQKEWRRTHKENVRRVRQKQKMKRHGLTIDDYERMLAAQNGVCVICKLPETAVKRGRVQLLTVEHCHVTGRVRGLTCNRCNRAIGMFDDNPALLRAAADYLESDS